MELLIGLVIIGIVVAAIEDQRDRSRNRERRMREFAQGIKGSSSKSRYQGARNRHVPFGRSTPFGVSGRTDKDYPAIVYLAKRNDVMKIGITSLASKRQRLAEHRKFGWKIRGEWTTSTLLVARQVEVAILRWWRNELGIGPALPPDSMLQGGASETVSTEHLDEKACIRMITHLLDGHGQFKLEHLSLGELTPGLLVATSGKVVRIEKAFVEMRSMKGRKYGETWWKVVLHDRGTYLTLEFAPRRDVAIRQLPLKTILQVEGRVERVEGHLRMTNPKWTVLDQET